MKKVICFLLTGFMFMYPCIEFAQNNDGVNDANSITIQELKDHLYYLASDELKGRLAGSEEFEIAADYAVSQFKQAGLKFLPLDSLGETDFKQMLYFNLYKVGPDDSLIFEKNGKKKVFSFPGDYVYENTLDPMKEEISGEVVFVGNGLYEPDLNWNDYEGVDIKDKWMVMFMEIEQEYLQDFTEVIENAGKTIDDIYDSKIDFIKKSEAKGVIFVLPENWLNIWDTWALDFGTKRILSDSNYQHKNDTRVQCISVNRDFLNLIFEDEAFDPLNHQGEYHSYSLKEAKISLHKELLLSNRKSPNIVAYIEGSDSIMKHEYVVLGAHLDHMGIEKGNIMNGADDNASGCTAVLEIAEAVALSKPKRSVVFVLFTGEEVGLMGSKYFVDHCPVNLDSIQLYVNLDVVGRADAPATGVAPFGYNMGPENLKDILTKVNSESVHLNLDYAFTDTTNFLNGSDHYAFYKKGIPFINFSDGLAGDAHTPDDDPEKIDFDYLKNISVLSYHLIMEVANREESLRTE